MSHEPLLVEFNVSGSSTSSQHMYIMKLVQPPYDTMTILQPTILLTTVLQPQPYTSSNGSIGHCHL